MFTILLSEMDADNNVKLHNGKEYHYLLEVFLAKEIIQDFTVTQGRKPSAEEAIQWVYEYGVNDG